MIVTVCSSTKIVTSKLKGTKFQRSAMFSHHCEELDSHNYTVNSVLSNSTGTLNDYYGPLHKGKI